MSLAQTQAEFRHWLEREDDAAGSRLGLADPRGLPVYLNNYRGQLMAYLEESFPKTLAWIGDHSFRAAAADHIEHCPPSSWTLDDYANGFPASLTKAWPHDPEVGELATLEHALDVAFIAVDSPALTVAELGEVDWDQAVLRLNPTCALLHFRTNASEIWTALTEGVKAPAAEPDGDVRVVLVWRRDWTCRFRLLNTDEAELLAGVSEGGERFDAICEKLVEQLGETEGIVRAGALLIQWTQDGVLCQP